MDGNHRTSYLLGVVDAGQRSNYVDRAVQTLLPLRSTFDAIAVRGMSGCTIGAILAQALTKHLILVRKPDREKSHSTDLAEGPLGWFPRARYIIVDDFRALGDTILSIQAAIGDQAQCVGLYLWQSNTYSQEANNAK